VLNSFVQLELIALAPHKSYPKFIKKLWECVRLRKPMARGLLRLIASQYRRRGDFQEGDK